MGIYQTEWTKDCTCQKSRSIGGVVAIRSIGTKPASVYGELPDSILDEGTTRYFRDVGGLWLLSHQQEINLSRAMRAGLEARRLREEGEEVDDLQIIFGKAHIAREDLISHNLRLVVTIAKKYRSSGLPQVDLIQEGNIGLMTAVGRYDPELGYRFSTYATFWMRHERCDVGLAIWTGSSGQSVVARSCYQWLQ